MNSVKYTLTNTGYHAVDNVIDDIVYINTFPVHSQTMLAVSEPVKNGLPIKDEVKYEIFKECV